MLGNFKYSNPTTLYFGDDALKYLNDELKQYGERILLVYGGGSIKQNGIYDEVMAILKANHKQVFEDAGVMPNPTYTKLLEGIKIAKDNDIDFILAVGGGSVIDYAKALSVSIKCPSDPWIKYYQNFEDVDNEIIPVGAVLTMVGTGSEMNGGAVITNKELNLKVGHVFDEKVFPKFSILNPKYTFTLPKNQMVAGIFDTLSHIMEQYFSGEDDNTSDYLAEGLMRSLITSAKIANIDPYNYEARSNIMWIATWALNTLIAKGKSTDWEVHMIGQAIGAITNATHGMTLSAISLAYYRHIFKCGLAKFKRFAINVWDVDPSNKDDETIALEGLIKMEAFMQELGLTMNISELGVNENNIDDVVNSTFIMEGGYKSLSKADIKAILKESL